MHFKTAWDHIRRAPIQAIAAILVLSITFFVVTVLSVIVYSSNKVLKYFETRPQVIIFVKDDASPEAITVLHDKVQQDLRVADVKYVSKEEALEIYKRVTSDNPLLAELVSPTIFPASLEVSLKELYDVEDFISEIKNDGAVEQVGYTAAVGGEDEFSRVVDQLRKITQNIRLIGGTFAGLNIVSSLLVLLIIIGMRMTMRRGEIEILNLIGATPGFVRAPVLIESLIYAMLGVILGWVFAFLLILYSTPGLILYFGEIPFLPRQTVDLVELFAIILGVELLIGIMLALTGSLVAVSRAKRV